MMEKTIFEKIIDGEIPSYKIYEDEHVYSFLDVFPITKGHTLVIPKKNNRNIFLNFFKFRRLNFLWRPFNF